MSEKATKWQVQLIEIRDLVFEVEASSAEEAEDFAMYMDVTEAVRDSYRSREADWVEKL